MSESLFGLSGDDYWREPWKNSEALHNKYVLEDKFGLYIDAPGEVDPTVRKSLPVPFFYVAQLREAYKVDLETMVKVVASRVEDRTLKIANALTPKDKRAKEPKVGKDSTDPTSEKEVLDLQAQLKLLGEKGTYHVLVLLRDQMSNVVVTRVVQRKIINEDPEVVKFLEIHRRPLPVPPPLPPSVELLWTPEAAGSMMPPKAPDGSPDMPAEPGIALSVERVVLKRLGATAVLKGAFRLKVLKRELVPPELPPDYQPPVAGPAQVPLSPLPGQPASLAAPDSADPAALLVRPIYGVPRPSAILPITLVILGYVDVAPTVIRLNVPTYDNLDPAAPEMVATGHFALDLLANPNIRLTPQTFAIYAFCGEIIAGPQLMATVTEAMLPKPGE